jgi:hypothetical protein
MTMLIPPPPRIDFCDITTDSTGKLRAKISRPWSQYFEEVFARLGGNIALTPQELEERINSSFLGVFGRQVIQDGNVNPGDAGGDATTWVLLARDQTGYQLPSNSANFTYDAATNTVSFGNITGSALGMTIQPKTPTALEDGLDLTIKTPNAAKTDAVGAKVSVLAGNGNGLGDGGGIEVFAGQSTSGSGGAINFQSGGGVIGGNFAFIAGNGTSSGGNFQLTGGSANNGVGGNLTLAGGADSFTGALGATASLSGASSLDPGDGGSGQFIAGSASGAVGGAGGSFDFLHGLDDGSGGAAGRLTFGSASGSVIEITQTAGAGAQKLGFFAATPKIRPAAYTQTYATAARTVPATLGTSVATTASALVSYGYTTQAQADSIPVQINNCQTEIENIKKVLNSLINDSSTTLGVGLNAT